MKRSPACIQRAKQIVLAKNGVLYGLSSEAASRVDFRKSKNMTDIVVLVDNCVERKLDTVLDDSLASHGEGYLFRYVQITLVCQTNGHGGLFCRRGPEVNITEFQPR